MTTDRQRCGIPAGYRAPDSAYAAFWFIVILLAAIVVLGGLGKLIPPLAEAMRSFGELGTWDEAVLALPSLTGRRRLPSPTSIWRAFLGVCRGRRESPRPMRFDARQRFRVQTDLAVDSYGNAVTVKRRVPPKLKRLKPYVQYLVNDYGEAAPVAARD